jgi:HSP20 family protein
VSFNDWKKQWNQFFNNDFWGQFEPFLDTTTSSTSTGVNIYQRENELLVVIALPGLERADQVEVYTHYKTLEIKTEIHLQFKNFELIEEGIFQGAFKKIIELPFPVNEQRVEAIYENGLLFIHLHRLIPDRIKRKIQVK